MHWSKPPPGFFKVNTDGSYVHGQAACGGIIRNHNGNFVKGFMCKLGSGNALFAELKGILFTLHIIREMQLTNVILETDSIHALNMIQNRYTSIFHLQPLLQEIIHLINRSGSTIRINHIHREANTCADALALRGHQADFSVSILDVIQPSIKLLIDKDLFNLIKVCIHDISQTSFNLIIKNIRHFCIKRKN
jgi:ribonuclease HI